MQRPSCCSLPQHRATTVRSTYPESVATLLAAGECLQAMIDREQLHPWDDCQDPRSMVQLGETAIVAVLHQSGSGPRTNDRRRMNHGHVLIAANYLTRKDIP